ncbi:MAG: transcriptional regulator [Candidatus Thermoplasmatota archaeon]|nr:transcriptional regulator [Candidatus Thermoplasmatota archaeon]
MEVLRPHEQTIPKKVDELEKMTHRWKAYVLPLVVDKNTGVILDGHHRYQVALRFNLLCLPCVLVDYTGDDSVELDVWPNCGRDSITKDEVIEAGLFEKLFPPKTSRHRLPDHLPPISMPLSRLLLPAVSLVE